MKTKLITKNQSPFILAHTKHLPPLNSLEAIVEYREIERGEEVKRDSKGYINRLTESVACRVGLSGLVPKDEPLMLPAKLARDFKVALGGYGTPPDWRCLPALGAQGIYKSRHGWVAWRIGGASNPYAALCGTADPKCSLAQIRINRFPK